MTNFADSIERIVTLPVGIERAWQAITDQAEVQQWFGDRSNYELRAGGQGVMQWGDDAFRIRIVTVDPPRHFAYRWVTPKDSDHSIPFEEVPTTLVSFTLEEIPGGTRLTLVESGFAAHPIEGRDANYADNSEGWTLELDRLVTYLQTGAAPPRS